MGPNPKSYHDAGNGANPPEATWQGQFKVASSSSGSGAQTIIIVLALVVFMMLRRVYRSYSGTRFSEAGTLLTLVLYGAIGAGLSILSFFEGVSLLLAVPYLILIAASSVWSYRYADRRIAFWRGGDGSVYFKGGVILYLIYVAGFVARLSIDIFVLGPNALTTFSTAETLTSTTLYATIATDLLLMFGLGLLIGRNARIIRRWRLINEGKETLPDSPPALEPIFGSKSNRLELTSPPFGKRAILSLHEVALVPYSLDTILNPIPIVIRVKKE